MKHGIFQVRPYIRVPKKKKIPRVLLNMEFYYSDSPNSPSTQTRSTSESAQGVHCLVTWNKVCRPVEYGGLGLHNLQLLNFLLRLRWLWLQRVEQDRPWSGFAIHLKSEVSDLFKASTKSLVGNGCITLFWSDS